MLGVLVYLYIMHVKSHLSTNAMVISVVQHLVFLRIVSLGSEAVRGVCFIEIILDTREKLYVGTNNTG